jgi:hypothetical protein
MKLITLGGWFLLIGLFTGWWGLGHLLFSSRQTHTIARVLAAILGFLLIEGGLWIVFS